MGIIHLGELTYGCNSTTDTLCHYGSFLCMTVLCLDFTTLVRNVSHSLRTRPVYLQVVKCAILS